MKKVIRAYHGQSKTVEGTTEETLSLSSVLTHYTSYAVLRLLGCLCSYRVSQKAVHREKCPKVSVNMISRINF